MKTKKVQRLAGGYLEKITDAAMAVEKEFDEDVIHDLRVNVKRLRAFLRLYWLFAGGARPALPRKLKKVYKAAGEIRDLQLLLKVVAGNEKLPEVFRRELDRQLAKAKDAWADVFDAKELLRARKKLETYPYKPIPAFMPGEFVKERLTLIDELRAADKNDDEDLHTVRKRVKDIVYIMRLIQDDWGKAITSVQHIPARKFEELADLAGAFNDTRQLKTKLSGLKPEGATTGEVAARRRYMSRVGKDLATQRKAVENYLSELGDGNFF